MKKWIAAITLLALTNICLGHSKLAPGQRGFYIGVGLGLDYGGLGAKAEVLPKQWISAFASAGFTSVDMGYNVGLCGHFFTKSHIRPVIFGMYGYNASVYGTFENFNGANRKERRLHFGFTVGTGAEFDIGKNKNKKIVVNFLLPLNDKNDFPEDAQIAPSFLSFGFNFGI